jgi:hypothetical protein
MRKLVPTHVVFEGRVDELTGKNALTAKVGETVLSREEELPRTGKTPLGLITSGTYSADAKRPANEAFPDNRSPSNAGTKCAAQPHHKDKDNAFSPWSSLPLRSVTSTLHAG